MTRRRFLGSVLLAAGAPVLAGLPTSGCGGEEDDVAPDADESPSPADAANVLDSNATGSDAHEVDAFMCVVTDASGPSDTHGHVVFIPKADVENPLDRTYTSTGGTHDHTFSITAAELMELAATCSVTVQSSDTHPHTWTIAMIG